METSRILALIGLIILSSSIIAYFSIDLGLIMFCVSSVALSVKWAWVD